MVQVIRVRKWKCARRRRRAIPIRCRWSWSVSKAGRDQTCTRIHHSRDIRNLLDRSYVFVFQAWTTYIGLRPPVTRDLTICVAFASMFSTTTPQNLLSGTAAKRCFPVQQDTACRVEVLPTRSPNCVGCPVTTNLSPNSRACANLSRNGWDRPPHDRITRARCQLAADPRRRLDWIVRPSEQRSQADPRQGTLALLLAGPQSGRMPATRPFATLQAGPRPQSGCARASESSSRQTPARRRLARVRPGGIRALPDRVTRKRAATSSGAPVF